MDKVLLHNYSETDFDMTIDEALEYLMHQSFVTLTISTLKSENLLIGCSGQLHFYTFTLNKEHLELIFGQDHMMINFGGINQFDTVYDEDNQELELIFQNNINDMILTLSCEYQHK